MARVARLTVYPVKGLDAHDLDAVRLLSGGTLAHDRAYALVDADGTRWNAKQSALFHRLDADYEPETGALTVTHGDATARFDLPAERDRAGDWFSDLFDADLELRHDDALGHVDRRRAGPSVISTATVETVAGWFDDLAPAAVRRRMRANVEVAGVPAFWEDRFVGDDAPAFEAGGVRFEGVEPCARCVVPERDHETGAHEPAFRERFVERRRETFPGFADPEAFDHGYTLMLIARVPEADRGATLRVGDAVAVV
jgi:uncharacterized protein YcbX